jgi:hypothetical protein
VYRLLCGDAALPGLLPDEILAAAAAGAYPPRDAIPSHVPPKVRKVVTKALQPEPDRRYPTMRSLRLALEQADPMVPWSPPIYAGNSTRWKGVGRDAAVWQITQVLNGAQSCVEVRRGKAATPRRITALGRDPMTEKDAVRHATRLLHDIADGKQARLEAKS